MFASSNQSVGSGVVNIVLGTPLIKRARAVYVGVGGDVNLQAGDGSTAVFKNVPAGAIIPVECLQVYGGGTTASQLVGLL